MSDLATPRPWAAEYCSVSDEWYLAAGAWPWGTGIASLQRHEAAKANAALIVTAVNERDALLAERDALREALTTAIDWLEDVQSDTYYQFDDDYTPEKERLIPRLRAVLNRDAKP